MIGFEILLPIHTKNPSNQNLGNSRAAAFAARGEMVRQRDTAHALIFQTMRRRGLRTSDITPCIVTMTRIAFGRGLDEHDNLRSALKRVVDGITLGLGLDDDRSPLVEWRYAQRRGKPREHAVLVRIEPKGSP